MARLAGTKREMVIIAGSSHYRVTPNSDGTLTISEILIAKGKHHDETLIKLANVGFNFVEIGETITRVDALGGRFQNLYKRAAK